MSIKQQVEDAVFLAENERHLGAFTTLMLAIAASSRKTFPKGKTKSLEDPTKKMGDREAFTLFVGGRIKKIIDSSVETDIGNSGIRVEFKGKRYDLAYILYKFYRCELVHDGELPEDIEFTDSSDNCNIHFHLNGFIVSIGVGNTMVLSYGWIDLLVKAVVYARCNGKIFGIDHFDFIVVDGVNEFEHCNKICQDYGIDPGFYKILKLATQHITPNCVVKDSDDILVKKFSDLASRKIINGGAITGLSFEGLTDRDGALLPRGLKIMKEIGIVYQLIAV